MLLASVVVVVWKVAVVVEPVIELDVVMVSDFVVVEVELVVMVIVEVVSVFLDVEVELSVTVVVEDVTEVVCAIFVASFLLVVMVVLLAKEDHQKIYKNNIEMS